ncbi:uncharacterized protein LOC121700828 [Alosa sapidissima]|uniref:uncharacterized protein LOC121700828 n=1 Tax=Alosa sapidissima TaxID=34773 RepID=UPI001C0A4A5D|nr:uncharacterized protein LOC121700828 [Alosa sapidissima]
MEHKRKKSAKLVQSEDLLNFIHMAEAALPQAIDDLTLNPGSSACLAKVAGLLVGAMVATTGHRKCVFLGMTTDDIMNAQPYKKSFTIRVAEHKTLEAFGPAMVSVSKYLMDRLRAFVCLRSTLPGFNKAPKVLFFTRNGQEMDKIGVYVKKVWREFGLPGAPNLGDIRTAISTWADKALSLKDRTDLNKAMCHDPKTASKYYVVGPEPTPKDARKIRLDILKALMDTVKPRQKKQAMRLVAFAGQTHLHKIKIDFQDFTLKHHSTDFLNLDFQLFDMDPGRDPSTEYMQRNEHAKSVSKMMTSESEDGQRQQQKGLKCKELDTANSTIKEEINLECFESSEDLEGLTVSMVGSSYKQALFLVVHV